MDRQLNPQLRESTWSEFRSVMALSFPIVVTTSSRALMDFVDSLMVSQLGTESMAAIIPAQMTVYIYIVLGMGSTMAVTTFASQALGRNQKSECSIYAWQGLWLSAIYGVLGTALWPLLPWVFHFYGHSAEVQNQEMAFAGILVMSIFPTVAGSALDSYFNGIHRPKVTMYTALEANVLNFVLNYVLIFGKFGFPEMGIAGSALGTTIACFYRMVRLWAVLAAPRYRAEFHSLSTWRWDTRRAWDIVRIGFPTGMQWLSDVVVWTLFVSGLIGKNFGTVELSASNIAWQYMRLSFMPALGVCRAITAMVGKAIGQGRKDRARRSTMMGLLITSGYMFLAGAAYFLWPEYLLSRFTDDPQVIQAGIAIMICAAVFQAFDGAGMAYVSALRGAGDTAWPSWMFIITHWVIIIGGGSLMVYWFPQWRGLGPWMAAAALLIFTAFLLGWRWHGGAWEKIQLFDGAKATEAMASSAVSAAQRESDKGLEPASVAT